MKPSRVSLVIISQIRRLVVFCQWIQGDTSTRWEPILRYQGAHHPALDPFKLEANKNVLIEYHEKMCNDSLKILCCRSVLIPMHPDNSTARIGKITDLISCAMA